MGEESEKLPLDAQLRLLEGENKLLKETLESVHSNLQGVADLVLSIIRNTQRDENGNPRH